MRRESNDEIYAYMCVVSVFLSLLHLAHCSISIEKKKIVNIDGIS